MVVGEILYERSSLHSQASALLLKLLFTKEPLSIQVHPHNAFAKAAGMKNGKTEAWYVLSAEKDAKVAIGLKQPLTVGGLREAIGNGSIDDLVKWQDACAGDIFFIPAGTIHAIGAGLVIAEIQQRSDTTFRLFDQGRARELHIEEAIAVADLEPTRMLDTRRSLTSHRTVLVSCEFFVLERIELPPYATCDLETEHESWTLVIAGDAVLGSMLAHLGDAFFSERGKVAVHVGSDGLVVLMAHTGGTAQSGLMRDAGPRMRVHIDSDRRQADMLQSKPVAPTSRSTKALS
jgi:mannose-6-phosphate isomerase